MTRRARRSPWSLTSPLLGRPAAYHARRYTYIPRSTKSTQFVVRYGAPLNPTLSQKKKGQGEGPAYLNSFAKNTATTEISLIRMFIEGPEVSLNGSPTVSPTTA